MNSVAIKKTKILTPFKKHILQDYSVIFPRSICDFFKMVLDGRSFTTESINAADVVDEQCWQKIIHALQIHSVICGIPR